MLDRAGVSTQRHMLEIYTDRLLIQGSVSLPFRRATEIMNNADRDFLTIDGARIAPLVQPAQMSGPHAVPTLVRRLQVCYVATATEPGQSKPTGQEFAGVHKVPTPCYGFVGPFVFHAHLHLRPGSQLFEVLETGQEQFIPLTGATVYLIERPDIPPRQHEVIILNRGRLDAIYLS